MTDIVPLGYTLMFMDSETGELSPADPLRQPAPAQQSETLKRGAAVFGGAGKQPEADSGLKKELTATKGQLTKARKRIAELEEQIVELKTQLSQASAGEADAAPATADDSEDEFDDLDLGDLDEENV